MSKEEKWTSEVTVRFVLLPKDNEAAYWAVMKYFAEVMFSDYEGNDYENS